MPSITSTLPETGQGGEAVVAMGRSPGRWYLLVRQAQTELQLLIAGVQNTTTEAAQTDLDVAGEQGPIKPAPLRAVSAEHLGL